MFTQYYNMFMHWNTIALEKKYTEFQRNLILVRYLITEKKYCWQDNNSNTLNLFMNQ